MINELSILIPVYNDNAVELVKTLQSQASDIEGLRYEIIVFDDGSTDVTKIETNQFVNILDNCRCVLSHHHSCRSEMRNAMQHHAKYDWCLMVDARLSVKYDDFILRYLCSGAALGGAVCGGVTVSASDGGSFNDSDSLLLTKKLYKENLRFRYEKYEERFHSLSVREKYPYKSFRTTNIFYHKSVLEHVPYDEKIKGYGYEDVKLGKELQDKGIPVLHIDNPVVYTSFESNERYLAKIEEALRTLREHDSELVDFSPLLMYERKFRCFHVLWMVKLFHSLFGHFEKHVLCGKAPSLFIFKLYKLGYLVSLPVD